MKDLSIVDGAVLLFKPLARISPEVETPLYQSPVVETPHWIPLFSKNPYWSK